MNYQGLAVVFTTATTYVIAGTPTAAAIGAAVSSAIMIVLSLFAAAASDLVDREL